MVLICAPFVFLSLGLWSLVFGSQVSFDIPDDDLPSMDLFANDTLLWGPYRSALYFGLRPRIPRSLLCGLMWFNVDTFQGFSQFRHFYQQGDNMLRANWVEFDPRIGGRQIIDDVDLHICITIDFIKSHDGKSWGVKVRAEPHIGFPEVRTSFVWYCGLETEKGVDIVGSPISQLEAGDNGMLVLDNAKDSRGYRGILKLSGVSESLGLFTMEINDGPITNRHPAFDVKEARDLNPQRTHHILLRVTNDNVWRAQDIFGTILQDSVKALSEQYEEVANFPPAQAFIIRDLLKFEGNLHFVQKVFQGECEFDVVFHSATTPAEDNVTFDNIKSKIDEGLLQVRAKFDTHFAPLSAPFNDIKYGAFSKEILSGLLGGLSYSFGLHLVDRETDFDEELFANVKLNGKLEGPHELFSLVPSRPFFPRGFYWDEGFHLLPLLKYDPDLVLEIIKSWFNLIDELGWIAREQILGPELRSRVPEEFQSQSPKVVNPPTLMLAFSYILEDALGETPEQVTQYGTFGERPSGRILVDNPDLLREYTQEIYPRLRSHYEMFRRTQQGYNEDFGREDMAEVYRWRGRTLTHCFASGLDDYPRTLPADIAELNVDLLSWIGVMTRSMKLMARLLDYTEDLATFEKIEADILHLLESVHWSPEHNTYCDVSVDDDDENVHACFKGYISLFPFLTKLLPLQDTAKLQHIVELIKDPNELWLPFGIRSLSKRDANYKTGENYWRSPVWLNINYLILELLQYYHGASTEANHELKLLIADTYHQLRLNLVNNVFSEWQRTGFVWEQYDDETGEAKGAKNFLGWTSTVLLIMKMPSNL